MEKLDRVLAENDATLTKLGVEECDLVWFVRSLRGRKRTHPVPGVINRDLTKDDLLERLQDDNSWAQITIGEKELTSIDDLLLVQRLSTMQMHIVSAGSVQLSKDVDESERMEIESNVLNYCPQIDRRGVGRYHLLQRAKAASSGWPLKMILSNFSRDRTARFIPNQFATCPNSGRSRLPGLG